MNRNKPQISPKPQICPNQCVNQCACWISGREGESLPQTLDDLAKTADMALIGYGFDRLALMGTQFQNALITTQNKGALIIGRGGYGAYQLSSDPWRLYRHRVTLRFCLTDYAHIVQTSPQSAEACELKTGHIAVANQAGSIFHRIQYYDPVDHYLAQIMAAEQDIGLDMSDTVVPDHYRQDSIDCRDGTNVISLDKLLRVKKNWDHMSLETHLSDIMVYQGQMRQKYLPHIGNNHARKIEKDVLGSFLKFLLQHSFALTLMVPSNGMLQCQSSALTRLEKIKYLLILQSEAYQMVIDQAQLSAIWVIRAGRRCWLELYGRDQTIHAVIMADPMANDCHWAELLDSLPS